MSSNEVKIIEYKPSDGAQAKIGQTLTVHYLVAKTIEDLEKGKWLDKSYGKNSIEFVLGQSQVLKGMDIGLVGMKVGSTRRVIIPPSLAFGSKGVPGKLLPDTELVFEVYLISADDQ